MYIQNYGIAKGDTHARTHPAASTLTSATKILSSNVNRQKFCLYNASASTTIFYIAFAATGVTPNVSATDFTVKLNAGDYYEDWNWVGEVHAIASASNSDTLNVTELY